VLVSHVKLIIVCVLAINNMFSPQTRDNECRILGKGNWCSEPIVIQVLSSGKRCGGTGRYEVADREFK
jgi:hypothetical protein